MTKAEKTRLTNPTSRPSLKPVNERVRPEITRLPKLSFPRQVARRLLRALARLLVWAFTNVEIYGQENIPLQGSALVVGNHLGDADFVIGVAYSPRFPDVLAKAELYDFPILGKLMDAYGVIWVHRGQPDRRALRAALRGLAEGRLISIAPEGRESLTGGLEEGTHGAAFLALKAGVPVIPATITGSENHCLYYNIKRLRRTSITLTVGPPFRLDLYEDRQDAIRLGTQQIMKALARQLPPEYQGIYRMDNGPDGPMPVQHQRRISPGEDPP